MSSPWKLININNIPKQLYANLNMQMLSRLRLIKVSDKNNNKYWKKTALNDQIIDFSRNNKVLLNENENLTLLLSAAHGSLDEMIGIIALLRACDYDIKKLVAKKNIREVYWDDFYSLYKNQNREYNSYCLSYECIYFIKIYSKRIEKLYIFYCFCI